MDNFLQALSEIKIDLPQVIEHRLYYDEQGLPLFYTCEKPDGNYVVVDTETYAQGRYDCKVVNGVIKYPVTTVHYKLIPSTKGVMCCANDVSIISSNRENSQGWEMKNYEKN